MTRCRSRTVAKVDSIVIWSALIENGFDLAVCVLDGVVDTGGIRRRMSVSTARSLPNCDVLPVGRRVEVARCRGVRRRRRRVGGAAAGSRRRVRGCGGGDFEATSQGVVAGALLGGYRCARLGSALVAESADIVGEVGLGVAARLLRTAGSHQERWPRPRPELDIADAVGARGRAGVAATVAVLLSPSRASAKLVLPVTVAAPVVGRTPGRCRPRTQPSAPSRAA